MSLLRALRSSLLPSLAAFSWPVFGAPPITLELYAIDNVYGIEKSIGSATLINEAGYFATKASLLRAERTTYYLREKSSQLHEVELVKDLSSMRTKQDTAIIKPRETTWLKRYQ